MPNLRIVGYALGYLVTFLVVLFSGCLTGCVVELGNQGEAGLRWGTEVTFFSRASKTADEYSEAVISSPLVHENKQKEKPTEGPPVP